MDYKKLSKNREKKIASQIKGRNHPGSGSMWFRKGDVSNSEILVEDKFTSHEKYSIQLSIINKLQKEAKVQNKVPILRFGFERENKSMNFACIEDIYCNILNKEIKLDFEDITEKNSRIFYLNDLYNYYTTSNYIIMIGMLSFCKKNRSFFIFEWDEFLQMEKEILC